MSIYGALDRLRYIAWDMDNNEGKTNDQANHTLNLDRDGVIAAAVNTPYQLNSVSAPGIYGITLSAAEQQFKNAALMGISSISGVKIFGPLNISSDQATLSTIQAFLNTIDGVVDNNALALITIDAAIGELKTGVTAQAIKAEALASIDAALSSVHGAGSWSTAAPGPVTVMGYTNSANSRITGMENVLSSIDSAVADNATALASIDAKTSQLEFNEDSFIKSDLMKINNISVTTDSLMFPDGAVYCDTSSGISGTTFPNGRTKKPVNNINDAVKIAEDNKLRIIKVRGTVTTSGQYNCRNKTVIATDGDTHLINDNDLDNSIFINFKTMNITGPGISGDFPNAKFIDCGITTWGGSFHGAGAEFLRCRIDLSTAWAPENDFKATKCSIEDSTLDLVNLTGTKVIDLFDCNGKLNLKSVALSGFIVNLYNFEGELTIDSTCTAGTINIYGGRGQITDNSAGTTVNYKPSFIDSEDIKTLITGVTTQAIKAAAIASIDTALSTTHGAGSWQSASIDGVTCTAFTLSAKAAIDALASVDAAINAKTTNLPTDPASNTEVNQNEAKLNILITGVTTAAFTQSAKSAIDAITSLDTVINAKTTNLPSDPASETNATANRVAVIGEVDANEAKLDIVLNGVSVNAISVNALASIDAQLSSVHGGGSWASAIVGSVTVSGYTANANSRISGMETALASIDSATQDSLKRDEYKDFMNKEVKNRDSNGNPTEYDIGTSLNKETIDVAYQTISGVDKADTETVQ